MKKICFCLTLLFFLFACATQQKYDNKLQGFVGKTEAQLVKKWGRPSSSKIMDNGNKVLTYTKANDIYVPSEFYLNNPDMLPGQETVYAPFTNDYDFTPYGETFGYKAEQICQTSFLIQNGYVTAWKWKGNNCVAY
ncbi:MAG: hypothetical protein J6A33_07750 [Alphaproteobacteria bacterium]|nr:hypothetical protein [Alphaproteobacteria bacterium]